MKRFLEKASKTFTPQKSTPAPATSPAPPTPHTPVSVPTAHQLAAIPHTPGLQPKFLVPAVPHPCPHDRIALLATKEGLLLRPHLHGATQSASHLCIPWGKAVHVEERSEDAAYIHADWSQCVVIHGILGVLELFSGSHLLVITARTDIGHLFDVTHAVYGVKGVTAIPLTEDRARIALNTFAARNEVAPRPSLKASNTIDTIHTPDSDSTSDSGQAHTGRVQFSDAKQIKVMTPLEKNEFSLNDEEPSPTSSGASTPSSEYSVTTTPVAQTLASRLSFWSRVSQRDNPPSTLAENQPLALAQDPETLDAIIRENKEEPGKVLESILDATAPPPISSEEKHSELEEKIIKECIREYTKGGMYFAYNFDITRSLQHKQEQVAKSQKQHDLLANLNALPSVEDLPLPGDSAQVLIEPYPTLPLWRRVDRQFWWNESLSKPFIDAGVHSYVLPVMQGHYQIASFELPREPVLGEAGESTIADYVVVSRRARDRAGLRYQRRGIDDDAHVANFVETETIMRVDREGLKNVFAYVQIRGSIPLFWTQGGYGLKPPPQISADRTHAENMDVLKRHFARTVPQYGPHAIINLAEQHGKEGSITQNYREYMTELNNPDAQYHEYDFHVETKGMKYENISKLIDSMERTFESQGFLWISDSTIMSRQKGVFRVNCIDCLDRTNVVQSAFARWVLNKQLGAVALLTPTLEGRAEAELAFNDVWANNGDAISRAYAGTSALKGDFTRTGKRDLGGMLNDGVNSLARMYTSTFSDWFCQAVIDFMLGNRTLSVFSEFLSRLKTADPIELIRLSKIRAEAIATSVSRVLAEGERLLSGWTVFSPEELDTKIAEKFEEKVLLLTAQALYIISYDYTLEKVRLYTRIPLGDISSITKGAYILSPLEEASRDPVQNAGFIISWMNYNQITRATSYSVRNSLDLTSSPIRPSFPSNVISSTATATRNSFSTLSRQSTVLSKLMNTNAPDSATMSDKTFAAFKVLPIDPARSRRESSTASTYAEPADDLTGAASCREAADLIVDSIHQACQDIGASHPGFVSDADVVSLADAQRMTSVYSKMEYGVKRLLWLGGG